MDVAVLFARKDSVYKSLPGVSVWDKERDARTWPGGGPVVAHPPCAQWGALRYLARRDLEERSLAPWSVSVVRRWGGVLEHPARSLLWRELHLPPPGCVDSFGGFTLGISQREFGHLADKPTLLYICGVRAGDVPDLPLSLSYATHVIDSSSRGRQGVKYVSKAGREHTPLFFAEWLVNLARRCYASAEA